MKNTGFSGKTRKALALAAGLVLLAPLGCESESRQEASTRRRLERQIRKLRSDDAEVSVEAAINLANKGPAAVGAVEALIEALSRSEESVRRHAAYALGKIGPGAEDAIGPLEKLLEDDGPVTRVWAVQSLVKIDPKADPHVDVLVEAMGHTDLGVRINAAGAIELIGARAAGAVPALIAGLRDLELRRHAARALGAIGPGASEAVGALERLTGDNDPDTADAAREAIGKIRQ